MTKLQHLAHSVGVYSLGFASGHGLIGGLLRRVVHRRGYALVPRRALRALLDASHADIMGPVKEPTR
jgi:hypothetical protein